MFFIRKPFNTFIMIFLLAAHLPSTQADEQQSAEQSASERDVGRQSFERRAEKKQPIWL